MRPQVRCTVRAIILVGEMGAGKSHVGQRLASERGFNFIEGDDLAGAEMAQAIRDLKRITFPMIDDLVFRMVDAVMIHQALGEDGVVVSQALYRRRHRKMLRDLLERSGVDVIFIWVKPPLRQHVRQLLSRTGGWRWVRYWLLSKPFFQRPKDADIYRNRRLLEGT